HPLPPLRGAAPVSVDREHATRARLLGEVRIHRAVDLVPVGVGQNHERARDEEGLRNPEPLDLSLEGVRGVVVPDADLRLPETACGDDLERIADDYPGDVEAVAGEVRLDRVK